MRILITGGAGYLGTELAIQLNKNPEVKEIVIFDNLSRGNYNLFLHSHLKGDKVKFIKGELLDSRTLQKVIKNIDVVYHLAAYQSNSNSEMEHHLQEQTNNWGTAELVYAVEASNVKQFIHIGSTAVYGFSNEPVDHTSVLTPKTPLATSLLRGEKHAERLFERISTQIIRCGELFGYGISMSANSTFNRYILEANYGGKLSIEGNGNQKRPCISIQSAVQILEALLSNSLPSGHYNLAEYNLSPMDFVEKIQPLFPELEMIFTNHHLELPGLTVNRDERLAGLLSEEPQTLAEDLKAFKDYLGDFGF